MSTIIRSITDVPGAEVYVICTDSFMSGWGSTKEKMNRCIFPCESREEATIVLNNAGRRTDMVCPSIVSRETLAQLIVSGREKEVWSLMNREACTRWYKAGETWGK